MNTQAKRLVDGLTLDSLRRSRSQKPGIRAKSLLILGAACGVLVGASAANATVFYQETVTGNDFVATLYFDVPNVGSTAGQVLDPGGVALIDYNGQPNIGALAESGDGSDQVFYINTDGTTVDSKGINLVAFPAPSYLPENFLLFNGGGGQTDVLFPNLTGEPVTTVLTVAAVPEPATWSLMLIGFGTIGAIARRSRRRSGADLILGKLV